MILILIWLVVLLVAAALALIPSGRRIAVYISVCSTSGLIVSIAVPTLADILAVKFPWVAGSSMPGSYIGGIFLGGPVGTALSFWMLYRFFRKRERKELM